MADYAITFARSARRELEALDASIVRRVISRIDGLAQDPRPSGSRKLQGEQNLWRIADALQTLTVTFAALGRSR